MPDFDDQHRPTAPGITGSPVVPAAGDQRDAVAQQLQGVDVALRDVADLPVADQVAVFTDLHQQLTGALAVTAAAAGPAEQPPQYRPGGPGHRGR